MSDELTALIVEDNNSHQVLFSRALESVGFACEIAPNVRRAKAILDSYKPTLVLIDIYLPGGEDGIELVKYIRSSDHLYDCNVITMTAGAAPDDQKRAIDAGCDLFLPKPIELAELAQHARQLANLT